jgi:hypothetical protein
MALTRIGRAIAFAPAIAARRLDDLAAAQALLERLDNASALTVMAGVLPASWAR